MKNPLFTIAFSLLIVIFSAATANAGLISYTDKWDVSQGVVVSGSSGALTGGWSSDPRNMFGGFYGSGPPDVINNTIFKDYQPKGYVHWVEWQTPAPITLQAFNLVAIHDSGGFEARNINYRGFSTFRLFAGGALVYTYQADPDKDLNYGGGVNYTGLNWLELYATITPTVARSFRAEFVQYGSGSSYYGDSQGPRIYELDGYGSTSTSVPEPGTAALLLVSSGLAVLLGSRRKIRE
jgi:hypothetical protein